ncbi:hypothetical protein ZWY2020_046880 [Hordeum vulgare]|nr:hypothetical protein ZWY2020_046880 [Hordeum vulgare]
MLRSETGVSVAAPPIQIGSQGALSRWLLGWLAGVANDEKEYMVQATYGLWLARNEARDGKRIAPPHAIVDSVSALVREWKTTHEQAARQPKDRPIQKWTVPDEGWINVNADGAMTKSGTKGGGGVVLRDHNGAFLAGEALFFGEVRDAEAAEILACRRAVQLASQRGVVKIHLELDNQGLVRMLQEQQRNMADVGPWIQEVKSMLSTFEACRVDWVRRSANGAAHKFARVGVGEGVCKEWVGVPPDFALGVISDDIPSFVG